MGERTLGLESKDQFLVAALTLDEYLPIFQMEKIILAPSASGNIRWFTGP